MDESSPLSFSTSSDWRKWLQENHKIKNGIWVIHYKKHVVAGGLKYEEGVEEALCFGWIDGKMRRIDNDRFAQRYSPRRKGSPWSMLNRVKAEELLRNGKMTPAGLIAIDEAKKNGMWEDAYTSRVKPDVPYELAQKLQEDVEAFNNFNGFSNSNQLMYVFWINSAKSVKTRAKRIDEVFLRSKNNMKPGERAADKK